MTDCERSLIIVFCACPKAPGPAAVAGALARKRHRIIWAPWLENKPNAYSKARRKWPEADIIVYYLNSKWRTATMAINN